MNIKYFTNEELIGIIFYSVLESEYWNSLIYDICKLDDDSRLEIRRGIIEKYSKHIRNLNEENKFIFNEIIDRLRDNLEQRNLKLKVPITINVEEFSKTLYQPSEFYFDFYLRIGLYKEVYNKSNNEIRKILSDWILENFNDSQRSILEKELDKHVVDNGNFFEIRNKIKNYIPF